jgi:hypothetical protein
MNAMIVSVQLRGEGKRARVEEYLRCEVQGGVEEARKAVTAMLKNRSDYAIGKTYSGRPGRKPAKTAPVMKPDDDRVADGEPQELTA